MQKCDTMKRPVCTEEPNNGQWLVKVDFAKKVIWLTSGTQPFGNPTAYVSWKAASVVLEDTRNGGIRRTKTFYITSLNVEREIDLGRSPLGYHNSSEIATFPCRLAR